MAGESTKPNTGHTTAHLTPDENTNDTKKERKRGHQSAIQAASFIEITEDAMIDAVAVALLCFWRSEACGGGAVQCERVRGQGSRGMSCDFPPNLLAFGAKAVAAVFLAGEQALQRGFSKYGGNI